MIIWKVLIATWHTILQHAFQGLVDEGLATAEGVYRTVYDRCGLGFETPEALYVERHYRAIGYMRPLAAWTVLQALKNRNKSL